MRRRDVLDYDPGGTIIWGELYYDHLTTLYPASASTRTHTVRHCMPETDQPAFGGFLSRRTGPAPRPLARTSTASPEGGHRGLHEAHRHHKPAAMVAMDGVFRRAMTDVGD